MTGGTQKEDTGQMAKQKDEGAVVAQVPPQANAEGPKTLHKFRNVWGGESMSVEPPQIHAGLIALRRAVGGLQAKRHP